MIMVYPYDIAPYPFSAHWNCLTLLVPFFKAELSVIITLLVFLLISQNIFLTMYPTLVSLWCLNAACMAELGPGMVEPWPHGLDWLLSKDFLQSSLSQRILHLSNFSHWQHALLWQYRWNWEFFGNINQRSFSSQHPWYCSLVSPNAHPPHCRRPSLTWSTSLCSQSPPTFCQSNLTLRSSPILHHSSTSWLHFQCL